MGGDKLIKHCAEKWDDIARLEAAILQLHGCGAIWHKTVRVHEVSRGQAVWEGMVEVFNLRGHPKAKCAYGWVHRDGKNDKGERFFIVLEIPPVESASTAVRVGQPSHKRQEMANDERKQLKRTERQIKFHSETFVATEAMREIIDEMKTHFTLTPILAVALLSGCTTGKNGLALDTVGPPPFQPLATSSTLTNGTLVIYSAFRRNADFNALDPYRPEYSDYKIFATDGKLLQRVHNNSGTILQDPVSVELSPGKYDVFARANGYGFVTVPVQLAAQQNTILHLEGDGFWPNVSVFNQTNAVRLPDGQLIGWRVATKL
jgi:hypothetical protein